MDDPVFDPWGADAEAPTPAPAPGRWRVPAGPPPSVPPVRAQARAPSVARPRHAGTMPPHARLSGTPGFLRSMAVPRMEEFALRLQMARHEAVVEDMLDTTPALVRLTVRPWRGPWTEELSPPRGTLELAMEPGPEERVAVRVWLFAEAEAPSEEVRVPPPKLGAAWLEGTVLDFVERLLARA